MTFEPLPALFTKDAKKLNPGLKLMISPWTPPAWMKEPPHLRGGKLQKKYFAVYAKYLIRTLDEFKKEGLDIHQMTLLNEPLIGDAQEKWYFPQAFMSVKDQQEFISQHLAPQLQARPDIKTKLLLHDHNWANSAAATELLKDANVKSVTGGIAYHCYDGGVSDMRRTMTENKDVPAFQTECTSSLGKENSEDFHWWMYNLSLNAIGYGAVGALGWNICLDEKGGPINGNGCSKCRGLFTVDKSKPKATVTYHNAYRALEHTSKYLQPKAVRIQSDDTKEQGISNVAFLNPDGSRVVVLRNDRGRDITISVRNENCQILTYKVPARGAVSMRWK